MTLLRAVAIACLVLDDAITTVDVVIACLVLDDDITSCGDSVFVLDDAITSCGDSVFGPG